MILPYAIETAVFMTALYLGYKLLLGNATFQSFKRKMVLIVLFGSLILPLFLPLFYRETADFSIEIGMPVVSLVEEAPAASDSSIRIPWRELALWIYSIGGILVLIQSAIMILRLIRLRRESVPLDGYENVLVNTRVPGPFSWGGIIIVRPEDCDEHLDLVLAHERAHLRKRHWIDLLVARAVVAFQWFSPAAWLLFRELRAIHEFEADAEASLGSPYDYQMMLIKKTVGPNFPVLADSLKSNLKIRLTMMMSKRSSEQRRWLAAALLPMACVAALGLSQPAAARILGSMESHPAVSEGKVSEYAATAQENLPIYAQEESAQAMDSPSSVAAESIAPAAVSAEETMAAAQEKKEEKKVDPSKLPVFINGTRYNGDLKSLNADQIESMQIRKDMPEYPDGVIFITLKSGVNPNDAAAQTVRIKPANNRPDAVMAPEEVAQFPGGMKGLFSWMKDHIQYQASAGEGRVIVKFIVEKDGKVSSPTIIKGVNPELDKEALRVVSEMPDWTPGKVNGEPVATYFNLPVLFKAPPAEEEGAKK